jgi:putative transposase
MSRPLRIEWPNGLYHVTTRGDRREAIVEDDADRLAWVELLGQTCQRFNWRVHAWCLMDNHYHVLLETPDANLSLGMRHLNGVWSQMFNRRHGRVGHVFQGRFKAVMVERESYLLELARYVVLNPVRAHMVAAAGDYAFSSYRATLGLPDALGGVDQGWFESDWLLAQFAALRAEALCLYEDFVRAGVGLPSVWRQLESQVFLGSAGFLADMQARLAGTQRLRDVPLQQQRPLPKPLAEWQAQHPRNTAMALAFASGHYRMHEIAHFFGVSPATVSRAVAQSRAGASSVEPLADSSNYTSGATAASGPLVAQAWTPTHIRSTASTPSNP